MAKKDNKIQMPGAFGGLMRYDDEFKSRFMLTPVQVIGIILSIVAFVVLLKVFFPVVGTEGLGGVVP